MQHGTHLPTQRAFDTLSIARSYVGAGLSVIPIAPGTKEPYSKLLPKEWDEAAQKALPTWRPYQNRQPHDKELLRWFDGTDAGIGIVGGAVSGGLLVIDADDLDAYEHWRTNVAALLSPQLLDQLPIVASARGRHIYVRMDTPRRNQKLATLGKTVLIETRGEGGYVLAPPSAHPSGALYTWLQGDAMAIPTLAPEQIMGLLDAARALTPTRMHPAGQPAGEEPSVIEAFNSAHTIEHILEQHGYQVERPGRYIRPGGERSSVVIASGRSTHYNTADLLYCEAPGGGLYSHSPFSAWCHLAHSGDTKAAVKAAAAELGIARAPSSADLLDQAKRALGLDHGTWPYFLHEGGIWMQRTEKDGSSKLPLLMTNFTAHIVAEVSQHDGETCTEFYRILATCGTRTRTIEMERSEFEGESALGRIVAALGAKARVNPLAQSRFILDAIKAFSAQVEEHTLHNHTGWVDGRYLFDNGAIDVAGWHDRSGESAERAHLPQRLERYRLDPPQGARLSDAMALFESLLDIAPPAVTVPLVGGVLLAPLIHQLDAPAPMIHVYGPTGSHKTSICCAALALWGDFTPAHPTDTWTSTANSVQRLGWHLKDAPMLLDDYKAANVKANQVTFLLQNYGDRMARGRLDANSEARAAYPVRGVMISSGEDQPEGEASTLARILSVPLARGVVHRGKLTAIQQDARLLHLITVGYVQWLASHLPVLVDACQQQFKQTRDVVLSLIEQHEHATNAGRVAGNVAALYVAWDVFGQYLGDAQAWSADQIAEWMKICKRELVNLARQQIDLTTSERYSQIFLETLRGVVASGRGVIVSMEGETEKDTLGGQILLGARDRQGVYLICNVAYDEVCRQFRSAGRAFGATQRAVSQLLSQDGLLVSTEAPSLVMHKRINGTRPICWHLPADIFER